jgi:hypothetical protein
MVQCRIHVEIFPDHRGLSAAVIKELKDEYNYGLCGTCISILIIKCANLLGIDHITSANSMFPYDAETVPVLSGCLDRLKRMHRMLDFASILTPSMLAADEISRHNTAVAGKGIHSCLFFPMVLKFYV